MRAIASLATARLASVFPWLIIIVVNHHLTPNHPSTRTPGNPNEQAAFHTGDKSFHIRGTGR